MKLSIITCTSLACIGFLSMFFPLACSGQSTDLVTKELVWFLPEHETSSPQFSEDGRLIVLVSRVHWPDGAEAEGLPESVFARLKRRKLRDPRFADPVIRVIDLKGNETCEVKYGISPSISADNKSILFSRQKKPLTGMRPLAETQAGNDIQVFDCDTKQARTMAEPPSGYFDNPIFLPNKDSFAFTTNEAVNGAMGGSVAIERVVMRDGVQESLFTKETTPAVSCPTESSRTLTAFQNMMCKQEWRLPSSFPTLVENVAVAGDKLLVLLARPIPSAGDMYLASHYELSLASVFPNREKLFAIGQVNMNTLWDASFQPLTNDELMIFMEYWRPFSLAARDWIPEASPRNVNRRSAYSPNGKYYLAIEPLKEEPRQFTVYRIADGKKLFTSPKMANVFDLVWSRDSRQFAVVALPVGRSRSAYHEDLTVYSIR